MQDGAAEGHALLQDWLSILAAQYNRHILGLSGDTAMQVTARLQPARRQDSLRLPLAHDQVSTQMKLWRKALVCRHLQADVAFESVEALQAVPRLTYGLLRSPLLVRRPDDHPDAATAARLLWVRTPHNSCKCGRFGLQAHWLWCVPSRRCHSHSSEDRMSL